MPTVKENDPALRGPLAVVAATRIRPSHGRFNGNLQRPRHVVQEAAGCPLHRGDIKPSQSPCGHGTLYERLEIRDELPVEIRRQTIVRLRNILDHMWKKNEMREYHTVLTKYRELAHLERFDEPEFASPQRMRAETDLHISKAIDPVALKHVSQAFSQVHKSVPQLSLSV